MRKKENYPKSRSLLGHKVPLALLAAAIEPDCVRGSTDRLISQICYDSRKILPGALFVAMPGLHVDGHSFIDRALDAGAAAVVHSHNLPKYRQEIAYLRVASSAAALSRTSACFYDYPSNKLKVIGVTGTNGKSTTAWMIYHLLRELRICVGLISTVGVDYGDGFSPNNEHVTTPMALETQAALKSMLINGVEFVVLEASSWGLSSVSKRLEDVTFHSGVITNFSHDHLELHGSTDQYLDAKLNLFRKLCGDGSFAVSPPELLKELEAVTEVPIYLFGLNANKNSSTSHSKKVFDPSIKGQVDRLVPAYTTTEWDKKISTQWTCRASEALNQRNNAQCLDFVLQIDQKLAKATLSMPGLFNLKNCLAATTVVSRYGHHPIQELLRAIARLRLPAGHMEEVSVGQPFRVIVDYAHTPEAFRETLSCLADQAQNMDGELIVVFGSAGERDIKKRPLQGHIACQYASLVILTDEDSRKEDPVQILEQIASGCTIKEKGTDLIIEVSREAAINYAMKAASPHDVVALLGKGHENSIIGPKGSRPWNERKVALAALYRAGYH